MSGADVVVVLAVVTGAKGVLLIERHDGQPPIAFPGGKVESGETIGQAAVRETAEETGLQVRVLDVLGTRTHPTTGAHITYVSAELVTPSARPSAPPTDEVVIAFWCPVPETLHVLGPSLFGPVREYLTRVEPGLRRT